MFHLDRSTRLHDVLSLVSVFLFIVQCSGQRVAGQDDLQPYSVYVDQEGVTARCGPGADYYRTDLLRHGQALEVYVETEDGWLGIRPPEGSFCWLPADVVKLSPSQDFGTITEENSLAWIGTHLGKANKYLWQVQLAKGEEVAIVGRAKREGPDGMKLWYRIVPPAGEFRWVHRDQVVENPELLVRDKPAAGARFADGKPTLAPEPREFADASNEPAARAQTNRRAEAVSVVQSRSSRQSADDEYADNEPPRSKPRSSDASLELPIPRPEASVSVVAQPIAPPVVSAEPIGSGVVYDDTVNRPYEAPLVAFTTSPRVAEIGTPYGQDTKAGAVAASTDQLADAFQQRAGSRGPVAAQPSPVDEQRLYVDRSRVTIQQAVVPVSNIVSTPGDGNSKVNADSIQLELSRLMARSATAAEIESIIAAADRLIKTSAMESDRQRASMIMQRAQQYQLVARRRDGSGLGGSVASASQAGIAAAANTTLSYPAPVQPMASSPAAMDNEFGAGQEATGYLVQVFSSRPDSPPFALTDSQGRTTHYVSAAPGVNLRRYLNQHVSVRGSSGYSTGLDTPHIIASGAVRQ